MDELTQRCIDLATVKHEISVALEEIEQGEDGITRLKRIIQE